MKVLFLSHRVPFPANKGEKIRTYHQIRFLVSRGHDIVVLAPYEDAAELAYAADLEKQLPVSVMMFPLQPKWLRLVKGLATHQALTLANFYSAELQRVFDKFVRSGDFDAVICTGSAMSSYVFGNAILEDHADSHKTRLIMDFMDLDSDKWSQYKATSAFPMNLVYGREARLVNRVEKRCYQRFDHCFFISVNEVELFSRQLPDGSRLQVLGNGIDTDMFFPRPAAGKSGHPVFLFTGVMNYKPNEDAVLWFVNSIWARLKSEWPGAEFIIAGMEPSSKIQQLGRQAGITVTGFVEDIVPYYQQADVFVAPFRLARGVQNKILQALACGLPVVTTSMGLEGIHARHGEDALVANSEEEIFGAVKQVLQGDGLYERLSQNGPCLIQRDHSWNSVLQDLATAVEVRAQE